VRMHCTCYDMSYILVNRHVPSVLRIVRCTLDAIGQLASAINKKYLKADADAPVIKPVLIVQCDQFGIAHAPFAQGRSFLTERGFGDCKVLIHQRRDGKKSGDAESDDSQADLRLVEVLARYVTEFMCHVAFNEVFDTESVLFLAAVNSLLPLQIFLEQLSQRITHRACE
jgi:hypothetical protein